LAFKELNTKKKNYTENLFYTSIRTYSNFFCLIINSDSYQDGFDKASKKEFAEISSETLVFRQKKFKYVLNKGELSKGRGRK